MAKLAILGGTKIRKNPFPPHAVIGAEEKREVAEVLKSGFLSGFIATVGEGFLGGPKVKKLEGLFRNYFKVKYAVAVNSATAGLHAAIAALGIGPGDEVIVPPYTMSASASAILMHNAIPVFADIEDETFCIDVSSIKKAITLRTKAIIVVHLFGHPAQMKKIMAFARKHHLKIIEDCAQSPGAIYNNRHVGTIGDVGIFSLNQHKTITCGEGGVVVTNNAAIAERLQLVRNHGEVIVGNMGINDIANTLGWNYRMTELEAAVGIGQFGRLDFLNNWRITMAEHLSVRLSGFEGLTMPKTMKGSSHVYFLFPVKYDEDKVGIERDLFVKALNAEGIPCAGGYVRPIYLEPMYQQKICYGKNGCPFTCTLHKGKIRYRKGICPTTERMYEKELMLLPVCRYPISKSDIGDVVQAFEKVFDNLKELKGLKTCSRRR